ncbi:MAG: hypothetical protein Q9174_001761 [Haloplaca sp. 1 TL-2023]
MPDLRGFTVHVVNGKGEELKEWGVQKLWGDKVSTYIQSATDMPFRVSIQPRLPYTDEPQSPMDDDQEEGWEDVGESPIKMDGLGDDSVIEQWASRPLPGDTSNKIGWNPPPSPHGRFWDHKRKIYRSHRRKDPGTMDHSFCTDQTPNDLPASTESSYAFLATLYIDGRTKPERKLVVWLDPSGQDFNQPDGLVHFKSRLVQGQDGTLEEQAWVFKDVGIEAVFDKIALQDGRQPPAEPEDVLVDAFNASGFGLERTAGVDEQGKVGKIVVELEKIRVGKPFYEKGWRPKHQEEEEEDVNMEDVNQDVAHKTGLKHRKNVERDIRIVHYHEIDKGERPWATFQFFYRSQEQLQRYGFPGFPRVEKQPLRDQRTFNAQLANLTPLSIAHSKWQAASSKKENGTTFEDRLKDGTLSSDNATPAYSFEGYRDTQAPKSTFAQEVQKHASHLLAKSTDPHEPKDGFSQYAKNHYNQPAVFAIKEQARRSSKSGFATGSSKHHYHNSSSSASSSEDDNDNKTPRTGLRHNSFAHPPDNDTSTSNPSHNPKASDPADILRILSDTSIALSKANDLTPKSALTSFRNPDYETDDNDADDEKEMETSRHAGDQETGDSDKENTGPSADRDDSGLHQRLRGVTLGAKRGLGEGVEDRDGGKKEEGGGGEKARELEMTMEESVRLEDGDLKAGKGVEKEEEGRVKRVKASPEKK